MSNLRKRLSDNEKSISCADACPNCGGRPTGGSTVWESDTEPDSCPECGRWVDENGRAIEEGSLAPDGRLHLKRIFLPPAEDTDTTAPKRENGDH